MVDIVAVDPHDDASVAEWWRVSTDAILHDRPQAFTRTLPHLRDIVQRPTRYYTRTLLAARLDGRTIGTAELGRSVRENLHLADLEVTVSPGHRRTVVGRRLYDEVARTCLADGRTTLIGEACVREGSSGAVDFARSLGFESVHVEDHFVLPLPVPPGHADRMGVGGLRDDYEVLTWTGRCPEEYVASYCLMQTQMSTDVPTGALDLEPVVVDEARVRELEDRTARTHHQIVAVSRRRGEASFAGYSVLFLDHTSDVVLQEDTLVMPGHRGHRLGLRMKLATLEIVRRDHPDRTVIHTWSAVDNAPMQRTNRDFGFVPVERLHEMQKKLTAPGAPSCPPDEA